MGRGSRGRYGSVGVSSGTQAHVYDQGTLLIDVTDTAGNKLVWRGARSQEVSGKSAPEKSTRMINETVAKITGTFPAGLKKTQ